MRGDILPLAKVGGSPRRMKRRERNKNDNLNKIQNSMEEMNPVRSQICLRGRLRALGTT